MEEVLYPLALQLWSPPTRSPWIGGYTAPVSQYISQCSSASPTEIQAVAANQSGCSSQCSAPFLVEQAIQEFPVFLQQEFHHPIHEYTRDQCRMSAISRDLLQRF